MPDKIVDIETISEGEIIQQIMDGIKKAMKNIKDEKTDPKKPREVICKFKMTPSDDRLSFQFKCETSVKLAAPIGVSGLVFIEEIEDKLIMKEHVPQEQIDMKLTYLK